MSDRRMAAESKAQSEGALRPEQEISRKGRKARKGRNGKEDASDVLVSYRRPSPVDRCRN
jgi:hypothetical protein